LKVTYTEEAVAHVDARFFLGRQRRRFVFDGLRRRTGPQEVRGAQEECRLREIY